MEGGNKKEKEKEEEGEGWNRTKRKVEKKRKKEKREKRKKKGKEGERTQSCHAYGKHVNTSTKRRDASKTLGVQMQKKKKKKIVKSCIVTMAIYNSSLFKLLILSMAASVIFSNKTDIHQNRYSQNRMRIFSLLCLNLDRNIFLCLMFVLQTSLALKAFFFTLILIQLVSLQLQDVFPALS